MTDEKKYWVHPWEADAPERIWVWGWRADSVWQEQTWQHEDEPMSTMEYVRADLLAALTEQLAAARKDADEAEAYEEELEAEVEKLRELLREARADLEHYVTHEYPKHLHPYYERQWNRDMELCRRIDAALASTDADNG